MTSIMLKCTRRFQICENIHSKYNIYICFTAHIVLYLSLWFKERLKINKTAKQIDFASNCWRQDNVSKYKKAYIHFKRVYILDYPLMSQW
jgi:hypothetical protein